MDGVARTSFGQRARDFRARAIARHVHDARGRMRRFAGHRDMRPFASRSNGAPMCTRSSIRATASRATSAAMSGSQSPAPAAIVSAACDCHVSPFADRRGDAALSPHARAGRADARAGEYQRGKWCELERREQAGEARAEDQCAFGFDDIVSPARHRALTRPRAAAAYRTASIRSTALLRARRSRHRQSLPLSSSRSEWRIFGKRNALHVRAQIAGPHEIDIGKFHRPRCRSSSIP